MSSRRLDGANGRLWALDRAEEAMGAPGARITPYSVGTLERLGANPGQMPLFPGLSFDSGTGEQGSCAPQAASFVPKMLLEFPSFHHSLCSVPYFPIPCRMLGVTTNLVTTSLTSGITTNPAFGFCRVRTKSINPS